MNKYTAAIITVSDKGSKGEREDTSGPALAQILELNGWDVIYTSIIPDEALAIKKELLHCCDTLNVALLLTTGGTGFSPRDITPEATMELIERKAQGISEYMRYKSGEITPRACLSRGVSGIRGQTLIINLPGSKKAATENINFVLDPIKHGIDMLLGEGSADCGEDKNTLDTDAVKGFGEVLAVCVSDKKGIQKTPVDSVELVENHGISGDAHAGNHHRQISLLAVESVDNLKNKTDVPLLPGAFGENILTKGLCLYKLPVGTKLKIGETLLEVTQIGKECHEGCAIKIKTGDCVMPREGIFAKVLHPGKVFEGNKIQVISE